jgi:CelD/BcsL family acetyltransferase involved in cellulose biosynthesis
VALHQKRRHDLGQTGCFDHPPFGDFLYDAGRELAGAGLLRLVIVAQGAAPVAVEFLLTTATTTFLYQAGMDPDYGSVRPGLLAMTYCLHSTAQRGATGVDMLRGEEPYKERWRATPSNTVELRVARPELAARLRHQLWVSSTAIKVWLKRRLPQRRTTDKQRVQAAGGVSDP